MTDRAHQLRYAIVTFGCRTNQADSFDIERDLRAHGGQPTDVESADLVIVNTCAVTSAAEQSARQAIRRVARLNPHARILAAGCYAVRAREELLALAIPRLDVVPADDRRETKDAGPETRDERRETTLPGPGTRGRTLHLLRVQTGCNEHCAYCIVPSTRGPSRSVPIARVLEQVAAAAAAGFKEVMITGVHLGCYGRDFQPATRLSELLRALAAGQPSVRFRVSAVEPMDFDAGVIEAVADTARFARHFHLPLQHASDRILSAMRRPYTLDGFRGTVESLRTACPGAAIGTDLIVGFPGETEVDFQACVDYLESSPLAYVHVFPFSSRPGTEAAAMGRRPRGDVVRQRVHRLRAIGLDLNRRFRERFVGSVREGLTIEDGTLVLTDNYLRVRIPMGLPRNERVTVRIDGETAGILSGTVVSASPTSPS